LVKVLYELAGILEAKVYVDTLTMCCKLTTLRTGMLEAERIECSID